MHPIYVNRANPKKRGRQYVGGHGRPYECTWCYSPAKLSGVRLRCSREGCPWGYELKVWNASPSPSRS